MVVYGEVTAQQGNSLDMQITEFLQGQDYRDTLRIWGKKDELCRPPASDFPVGSRWIMALQRIDSPPADGFDPFRPNISFGRKDDFFLSSCGVYWLPVNSERVAGNILDGSRWQYRDDKKTPVILPLFREWLAGKLDDTRLAEAAKPQTKARELLNNTRLFLLEQQREEDQPE